MKGTMPARNTKITVFLTPVDMDLEMLDIFEYGTPLGIAEVVLGSGESIE